MAGMCCGVVGETKTPSTSTVEPQSRRRRMEIQQLKLFAAAASNMVVPENKSKRRKVIENSVRSNKLKQEEADCSGASDSSSEIFDKKSSRFGLTVVCGRRRDLEDAVAVKPSFCKTDSPDSDDLHFYGVYDGHGCSHVAMKCKDRMHEIVKEEVKKSIEWKETMLKSFTRMDKDVTEWSSYDSSLNCRCELQTPQCDAVGSTAVVAVVTPDKIVVSNCGDSRAVLCRNGVAIPLSTDHKPDRPDELERIEQAGGRVIYWDGARVLGVLAMSRAIGDSYLKPYVIPEPEVTITERTTEDECLIIASDGLWDVVSNDVACSVASMCLSAHKVPSPPRSPGSVLNVARGESSDKACSDASILLTKLALARHSSDNVSVLVVDLRKNL
ncbi:protein phosphatase 2C 37-like [Bidens hawaiensis]|uniref:protein phosphatase 2C 37-like n=1 Tax=Bidens hawaiensis TaxID=980011 RepID=UPI00404AFD52